MDPNVIQDEDFIIEYLGDHPDEYSCVDEHESSLLQIYSDTKYEELQDFLLENFPEIVYSENRMGRNVLFDAIDANNASLIQKVLDIYPEGLWCVDDSGETPIVYECRCFGSAYDSTVLDVLLSYANEIDFETLFYIFGQACNNFPKVLCVLSHFPHLYDYSDDEYGSILHYVSTHAFTSQVSLVKHIISKRPDLLMSRDAFGRTPAHKVFRYDTLALMAASCPECLYIQDVDGKTPLHFLKVITQTDWVITHNGWQKDLDFLETRPELLHIQDKKGMTVTMSLMKSSQAYKIFPIFAKFAPDSLAIQDDKGQTCLHHCALYKMTEWDFIARDIIDRCPELITIRDKSGKTPMDIAYSNYGSFNVPLARERFFATCLKHQSIPDEYWPVFWNISPILTKSFGKIFARSEEDAAKAFKYMNKTEQGRVVAMMSLGKYIHQHMVKKILSLL